MARRSSIRNAEKPGSGVRARGSGDRRCLIVAALILACGSAFGMQVPAGTEVQVRLKSKVSTQSTKPKDAGEVVVTAPVMIDGQFAIPAGAVVRGNVETATQSAKGDERSVLKLAFTEIEIDGVKTKIAARVSGVDNARESVDEKGEISGIIASET